MVKKTIFISSEIYLYPIKTMVKITLAAGDMDKDLSGYLSFTGFTQFQMPNNHFSIVEE